MPPSLSCVETSCIPLLAACAGRLAYIPRENARARRRRGARHAAPELVSGHARRAVTWLQACQARGRVVTPGGGGQTLGAGAMGDGAAVPSRFRTICVFCGSSAGRRKVFGDAALDLGHELVRRGVDLVYGGGSIGLMGLIARSVLDGGCRVVGVIPRALMPVEISGESVGEVMVVSDMHERKAEMARRSEAFIALPGGYGTMEELLEMITWCQLGIHDKPVGLLNVDGYYDPLLALFDKGEAEGFINPDCRQIFVSAPTASELLTKMEQYTRLHQEVAPATSWKISQLGYGRTPDAES